MKNVTIATKKTAATTEIKNKKTYGALGAIKGDIIRTRDSRETESDSNFVAVTIMIKEGDRAGSYATLFLNNDIADKFRTANADRSYVGSDVEIYGRVASSTNTSKKDGKEYTNYSISLAKKSECPAGVKSLRFIRAEYEVEFA